jgi:hypothetical protein
MAAVDPDAALRLVKNVADVYGQATADLLELVARRLARGVDQAGWAERKLLEQAALRDDMAAIVSQLTADGTAAIDEALARAVATGHRIAVADDAFVRTNTAAVAKIAESSTATIASEIALLPENMAGTILRKTTDAYRGVIGETAAQVVTGAQTTRQALQRSLDRFADRGIVGFVDAAGRNWSMTAYAEMATRSASARAMVGARVDGYLAGGRNFVIVSDAPQECSRCREFEGKVLSIDGSGVGSKLDDGVRVFATVRDATSRGLFHPNCRHDLRPYLPGVTPRYTHTSDPKGDADRQEQRRLERGVRKWKQREAVAIDPASKAAAKARRIEWQRGLTEHVKVNDLKRLRYRESVAR